MLPVQRCNMHQVPFEHGMMMGVVSLIISVGTGTGPVYEEVVLVKRLGMTFLPGPPPLLWHSVRSCLSNTDNESHIRPFDATGVPSLHLVFLIVVG